MADLYFDWKEQREYLERESRRQQEATAYHREMMQKYQGPIRRSAQMIPDFARDFYYGNPPWNKVPEVPKKSSSDVDLIRKAGKE